MADSVQDRLNVASPGDISDRFRQVSMGDILAGLIPAERTRTGLTSGATHVHDVAGMIITVALGTAPVLIVASADTPAAGEVGITYDTNGVATLLFGDGANTAYTVVAMSLPAGLGASLALEA